MPRGARPEHRRGGKRPGAGAPKGNLNRLKHGRNSRQLQILVDLVAEIPELRDMFLAYHRSLQRKNRQARRAAFDILSQLLQPPPKTSEQFNQTIDRLRKASSK
ncbi:MAG: hypothetical protein ACE5KI_02720 [Dehalococcoidia bacterium]